MGARVLMEIRDGLLGDTEASARKGVPGIGRGGPWGLAGVWQPRGGWDSPTPRLETHHCSSCWESGPADAFSVPVSFHLI